MCTIHDTLSIIQFCTFFMNNNITGSPQPGDTDPSTVKDIKENEDKKEEFLGATTIKGSQQAEMSRAETPRESVIAVKKRKPCSISFTMKGAEELGKNAFLLTCMVLIIAAAVGYYHLYVEQQEELQTANKCEHNYFALFST